MELKYCRDGIDDDESSEMKKKMKKKIEQWAKTTNDIYVNIGVTMYFLTNDEQNEYQNVNKRVHTFLLLLLFCELHYLGV